MTSIAFGLACIGCLLLSLSLRRHYRQALSDASAYERRLWPLRIGGYGCVVLALWPSVRAAGVWVGFVLWISMLAAGAMLQALLLTWRPQATAVFGGLCVLLIAGGLLL